MFLDEQVEAGVPAWGEGRVGKSPPWKNQGGHCEWSISMLRWLSSVGWITSSFLWHNLQDQLTRTAWLKIVFTSMINARMILDYRGNIATTMSNSWHSRTAVSVTATMLWLVMIIQTITYAVVMQSKRVRGEVIKMTSISLYLDNCRMVFVHPFY